MEVALLLGLVALLGIGFVLAALAFTMASNLARESAVPPWPRRLMAGGVFLAAMCSLLILIAPGSAPWWDYSPADYATRLLIALAGGVLALLAIGLAKVGSRSTM